jgi:hypothetical protein
MGNSQFSATQWMGRSGERDIYHAKAMWCAGCALGEQPSRTLKSASIYLRAAINARYMDSDHLQEFNCSSPWLLGEDAQCMAPRPSTLSSMSVSVWNLRSRHPPPQIGGMLGSMHLARSELGALVSSRTGIGPDCARNGGDEGREDCSKKKEGKRGGGLSS